MRGGGSGDKGRAAGEGQRPAPGPRRLSDDGQDGQGHLCGQGQEAEKPGEPVFSGQRLPHRQDAEHGVPGGPVRHHLRHQRVRGPGAGELPHQAAHAPLQHPAEGRQGLPLCPPVQGGVSPLYPGEQDGPGRRPVFRPLRRPVRDPAGPGRGAVRPAAAHLQPEIPPGHRGGAALPELPHGPVRRVLPPGDDGGGVQSPDRAGGAAAGGKEQAAPPGHDRRDGGGGGGPPLRAGGHAPGPDQCHRRPGEEADRHRRPLRGHGHLGAVPGLRQVLLRHPPHGGGQPGGPGDRALRRSQRGDGGGDALRPDGPVLPAPVHPAPRDPAAL